MKRIKTLSITSALFAYATPFLVFAQTTIGQQKVLTILGNAVRAARILVAFAFLVALFMFAWGIVRFISAAGDPEKIREAKQFLLWGVIGMAVLASIYGLIAFLQSYFGVPGTTGTIFIPGVPGEAPTGGGSYCEINPSDPACGF